MANFNKPEPGESARCTPTTRGRKSVHGDGPEQRRSTILKCAAELIERQGLQGTTVREIGDSAGILQGSLYHHFESKEAIAKALLIRFFSEFESATMQTQRAALGAIETVELLVRSTFRIGSKHLAALTILQNDRAYLGRLPGFTFIAEAEVRLARVWSETVETGRKDGSVREGFEPDLAYRVYCVSIFSALIGTFALDRHPDDGFIDSYIKIVVGGLMA